VLAATAAPRSRRWWWWLGAPLVAAIAVLLWLVPRPSVNLAYMTISERVDRSRTRGEPRNTAHLGDTLRLTARSRGTYREIRVYRGDHLELRCPGDPGCRGADAAEIALSRSGSYDLVGLAASEPIPPPGGSLDIDLAAAGRAGVEVQNTHLTVD
jgi:hypothetical protein